LSSVIGAVPHPKGMIRVKIQNGTPQVVLPPGVTGELVWRGKTWKLAGDVQQPIG
jgi:hypothetical protein